MLIGRVIYWKILINLNMEQIVVRMYKQGSSAPQIAQKMLVKKDRIYSILRKYGIKRRTPAERFRLSRPSFTFRWPKTFYLRNLFIAGTMLYIGEGAKTGNTVDFANSDPKTLQLFILFLRKIFLINENKLRLYLYCFFDQNIDAIKAFWSSKLGIPNDKFIKPYIRAYKSKTKRIMTWGVLHIRYNDKRLLEKILSLCSDLLAELIENQANNLGRYSSGQRGQTVKRQPIGETR